ncbi:hypothetical protein [Lactiplantibacillus mudanjiangensis]|uniref:Uncharacterized protein n=1 Tax=Lactiplantibacillus mudanjiangensis TaxID=1296538 RepID=A0A660DXH0_9LACO|nr:hypothetical protein [Lactiplantibacillus mudanjiangensis]VDG23690.1 hypothetical protein [Lactobacillus plantarum] [Lactiplantibacillus mudanjiangensis]VDG27833.1 hypothetical protein [Lactobacillus plantarum] [Lactiplantibacillus mudanjiangensis]
MKIAIENESRSISVESNNDLTFEEAIKIHELVTGTKYLEPVLQKSEHAVTVINNGADKDVDKKKEDESDLQDTPENVEHLKTSIAEKWPLNHYGVPVRGDFVDGAIHCPVCNYSGIERVKFGYSFWRCPSCETKLFMGWATGVKGEVDESGCYYVLGQEYKPKWAENNETDEELPKPNAYSTLKEIKAYLDAHNVDYSQARLKADFVRLLEDN